VIILIEVIINQTQIFMKNNRIVIALCAGILLFSCQETDENVDLTQQKNFEEIVYSSKEFPAVDVVKYSENARQLPSEGKAKLYMAEYITASGSGEMGRTVIFDNKGSKKLFSDFAVTNKGGDELDYVDPTIYYYVDEFRPSSSISVPDATMSLDYAAMTWNEVNCSDFNFSKVPSIPVPIGVVANQLGFLSIPVYIAEVENLGFMPKEFFDFLAPGGGNFILGVTFTFYWIDENGDPDDFNGDGKPDTAFREIYYNDNFPWAADGSHIDLQTVGLHEMGHGLSQGHFGTAFFKKNGDVQFSPRAVMNASYSGIQHEIMKTDLAGHCSIWANWPNK